MCFILVRVDLEAGTLDRMPVQVPCRHTITQLNIDNPSTSTFFFFFFWRGNWNLQNFCTALEQGTLELGRCYTLYDCAINILTRNKLYYICFAWVRKMYFVTQQQYLPEIIWHIEAFKYKAYTVLRGLIKTGWTPQLHCLAHEYLCTLLPNKNSDL